MAGKYKCNPKISRNRARGNAESKMKTCIIGELPQALADIFSQIDVIQNRSAESVKDRVLNLWASGKSGRQISQELTDLKLTENQIRNIICQARYEGDKRAVYRSGWSRPEKH